MTLRFVDCQGFAGGFSAGATLAGLRLVGKVENVGGFGVPLMKANRAFLGDGWRTQVGPAATWEPVETDVVIGTPPCSGFSAMTAGMGEAHGVDAPINQCMRDLIAYAARMRPAAVVMESVPTAFTVGRELMAWLAEDLKRRTSLPYHVTHVLQNNLSTGGCTNRRRYFLVLSQTPFGVERPELLWLPTVGSALADLQDLPLRWDAQPVTSEPTWWSAGLRSYTGTVDGHETVYNPFAQRIMDVAGFDRPDAVPWHEGEREKDVLRRYYETHGQLPESYRFEVPRGAGRDRGLTRDKHLLEKGFNPGGFSQPRCWAWDKPGHVINGAGPYLVWHHRNRRFLTHREVARLMGFPDDWLVGTAATANALHQFWGKGTSVHPAKWLMTWLRESILADPGSVRGELLDDGSRLIDVSGDWRALVKAGRTSVKTVEDEPDETSTEVSDLSELVS